MRPVTTDRQLIRIGSDLDGGYLVPDDLEGIYACFSPGTGGNVSFEREIAGRGIRCFLADYSVDAPPIWHDLFDFEKRYLGATDTSPYMTLRSWLARKQVPASKDLILQMDIEGEEYAVLLEADLATLRRFRIMVIEFHGLETLCNKAGFNLIHLTFQKLLKYFDIVHIHPNNADKPILYGNYHIPPTMEFTFLRKDRAAERKASLSFPHLLDRVNEPNKEDFSLPDCWFR